MIVERALEIKKELIRGDKYFYGPKEVLRIYKQRHTDWKVPSIDFIKRVCRANGLVKKINKRQAGRSCYQHYPAHTIETLSDSISELDFVGEKYINGQTEPINIISYNSLYPFKYREFAMVLSQTSKEGIRGKDLTPEQIVNQATENYCPSISYTYSEPFVSWEYVYEIAKLARNKGIKNVTVSNGFINPVPLNKLCKYLTTPPFVKYSFGWCKY